MSAVKKTSVVKKKSAVAASHPPFADMIKECIAAHPAEARAGVSRPTIKKFLETKYRLQISPSTANNINRAIANGAEKGLFVLPKGPSGKVKLAPKARSDAGKENAAPVPAPAKVKAAKKPVKPVKKATVAGGRTKKPTTTAKKVSTTKKTTVASKKTAKPATKTSAKAATKSTAKSAKPVKKTTSTTKKAAKTTTTKKPAAKRAPAKKTLVGTSTNKPKSSTTKTKAPAKKVSAPTKRKAPTKRG